MHQPAQLVSVLLPHRHHKAAAAHGDDSVL